MIINPRNAMVSQTAPQIIVANVPAQLVHGNRAEFRDNIVGLFTQGRDVVLDFSACRYADSAGLGALFTLKRIANEHRRGLFLCNLSDELITLFELTKMDSIFDLYPSIDAAVNKMASAR